MIFVGIDLGFSGAIAEIDGLGHVTLVKDMFTSTVAVGKRTRTTYDFSAVSGLLRDLHPSAVCVEDIFHLGFRGSLAARAAGMGWGMVRTVCALCEIPVLAVSPREWQRVMLAGRARGKGASRARAEELFPGADLGPKGSEGRAEALLLAEYGRRMQCSGAS